MQANIEADIHPEALARHEKHGQPQSEVDYLAFRIEETLHHWVKDTAKGIVTSVATVLFVLLLVQLGLAQQGQELSFELFSPYEFWKSFSGLVVEWSQWNEWMLLGLGVVGLLPTAAIYVWLRRQHRHEPEKEAAAELSELEQEHLKAPKREPLLKRAEERLMSMRTVGTFGMLSALFLGSYMYQQYLWRVELPVPPQQIGIAFTRQVGSNIAIDKLADSLRKSGHENQIVIRDLPVTFDARDTEKARGFARRINAQAVVIFREETVDSSAPTAVQASMNVAGAGAQPAPAANHYVAYLVFADPSLGLEIPVAKDGANSADSVQYRTKEGIDAPRLEANDVDALMEEAAGILMYDRDRYLQAVAHLKNALATAQSGPSANPSGDALAYFYLGNSYYLVDQDAPAADAFDHAIKIGEAQKDPGVQDRLLLAQAYTYRATIYFNARKLDEAEALLKKAIALRTPLDNDASALADPANFRRLHETEGTAYVKLMELASYRKDDDTSKLWSKRAEDEARTLASRPDDTRAQASAIRMYYLSGNCQQAYDMAYSLLDKNPNDLAAHRAVANIAALRDGLWNSIEEKAHIDALLQINPTSLPDLHNLLLYYSLRSGMQDPGYAPKVAEAADTILAIDPDNVEALERYVNAVDGFVGLDLLPQVVNFQAPIGDFRTFLKIQSKQLEDPAQIKRVMAEKEAARPYLTRWAEEAEPDSVRPLMYAARFDQHETSYLDLYMGQGGTVDPAVQQIYDQSWQRTLKDANRVLESNRKPTARDQAEAHNIISELYRADYLKKLLRQDNKGAGESLQSALTHAEQAQKLLDSSPAANFDDLLLDSAINNSYMTAAYFASIFYNMQGDQVQSDKYNTLYQTLQSRSTDLANKAADPLLKDQQYFNSLACPGNELLVQGGQALQTGDNGKALDLFSQYKKMYPRDPQADWDLGWAQYLKGDLDAAAQSTAAFVKSAPDAPAAPDNLAIILLAKGDSEGAAGAIKEMLARLDREPLGTRMQDLTGFGNDLLGVVQRDRKSWAGTAAIMPLLRDYVAALPSEAHTDKAGQLIQALNNLGASAAWAGDYKAADSLLNSALQLNSDYVTARANLGLSKLASGGAAGAKDEYDKAITSAATYLLTLSGKPLTDDALASAKQEAATALNDAATGLDRLMVARPELKASGAPLLKVLQDAAAKYETAGPKAVR